VYITYENQEKIIMTRILITGGTGDLGSHLAQRLTSHTVRIMSRSPKSDPTKEWAQANLASGEGISEAVRGVDVIVHAATNPLKNFRETDIEGTRRLLDAAKKAGVAHFIYISIVGIERIPYFYYNMKVEVENMVKASGVPYSISRATQFHSFVDRILMMLDRFPLVLPHPTRFQFQTIDTGEYADFLIPFITAPPAGMLPDAAGPRVMRLEDMARLWLQARGERKMRLPLPLPGKVAHGFRHGYNTAPHRAVGKLTWETWLAQKYTRSTFSPATVQ
jgi:uncharacterized protein YbjT (DUF2867 family)